MSDLNEKLAQEAAELINGGEWRDGKWYSDGHREAWRRALKPAADRIEKLEAALTHIWAWYPVSVSNPHETIDAIKDYAFAAIKGEKKDD